MQQFYSTGTFQYSRSTRLEEPPPVSLPSWRFAELVVQAMDHSVQTRYEGQISRAGVQFALCGPLYLCSVYLLQRKGVGKQCDKGPLCQFRMFAVLMYPNIQFCVIQIADEEEISCADVRSALCSSSICADVGPLFVHCLLVQAGCTSTEARVVVQCRCPMFNLPQLLVTAHVQGGAVLHMYCTVLHM